MSKLKPLSIHRIKSCSTQRDYRCRLSGLAERSSNSSQIWCWPKSSLLEWSRLEIVLEHRLALSPSSMWYTLCSLSARIKAILTLNNFKWLSVILLRSLASTGWGNLPCQRSTAELWLSLNNYVPNTLSVRSCSMQQENICKLTRASYVCSQWATSESPIRMRVL